MKLISTFTDFRREDENYEICHDFILSNLRFHRYLDTSSQDMKKKAQGLIEKFLVHAQYTKAEKMKKCLRSLESLTDFNVLRFIMLLANKPTEFEYVEDFSIEEEEVTDDFNWPEYLRSDLEEYNLESVFSSDEEFFNEETGENDDETEENEELKHETHNNNNNTIVEHRNFIEQPSLLSLMKDIEHHDGLEQRVINDYWRSGGKYENVQSSIPAANFYNNWYVNIIKFSHAQLIKYSFYPRKVCIFNRFIST